MKYVYPKFDGIDLYFVRLGGSGLGNLLYPFFKALVYAKKENLGIISPTFLSIKIGPYLRRELQKRNYKYSFKGSITGIRRLLLLIFSNEIVTFKSFGDGFKSLYGYEDFLKEKFKSLTRVDFDEKKYQHSICCHIRLGDFKQSLGEELSNNTRIPIKWYKDVIQQIRKNDKELKVFLYSDGNDNELKELLELGNINNETSSNPVEDILKLSSSKYLIGSYSSFSFWGAFFSKGTCIWHQNAFNINEFPLNCINKILYKNQFIKTPHNE